MGARKLISAVALLAACSAGAAAAPVLAGNGHSGGWKTEPARPGLGPQGTCLPPYSKLAPGRKTTFMYRMQRPFDVELTGEMAADNPSGLPIRQRDIFMVSSHQNSTAFAGEMVDRLTDPRMLSGELFRCNRIAGLNGLNAEGTVRTEDAYALGDDQRVWALMPNWEQPQFNRAYPDTPGPDNIDPEPEWTGDFDRTVNRVKERVNGIHGFGKSAGTVMTGWRNQGPNAWPYAILQKRTGLDTQTVEVQEECLKGVTQLKRRVRALMNEYRTAKLPTGNLGFEISVSNDPSGATLHNDVTPARGAACVKAAYGVGARAFFLFANPRGLVPFFTALPDYIRH